ncbi:tetratricopeptide repeat protein [Marinobacter halotolerans]|uniref:tetratricopeptide repeat protein n=1 Tax=Marinobacter halotolerans TaxID=1569211 RepID=UPI001244816C|nr:tetratricopeptide repeat protein [Marinobacter halotolerans]
MRRNRESFFSLPALILLGALIALALYLLYPRQSVFEDANYLEKPDALSIAYLEVLLRSDSDNVPLRLSLAKALGATGQIDRAEQVLGPLMAQDPVPEKAFESWLELQAKRVFAVPAGPERNTRQDELFIAGQQLIRQPYEPERILELLRPMADWISQHRYLSLLQSTLPQMTSPGQKLQLAREVARLQEAQGQPGAAAETLRAQLETATPDARPELIDRIIALELASGNPGAALALFKQRQPARNMTEKTLNEGIRLARLAGSAEDEVAWIRQRADNNRGNLDYQRELLAIQLAAGKPLAALTAVRRLQKKPDRLTPTDRQRIAKVLEWNGLAQEALPVWVSLYQNTGSDRAFRRSVDLARGLFQWDTLLAVLSDAAKRRTLQPSGYVDLADALVQAGRFEDARAQLVSGRAAYPDSSVIRDRLLELLMNLRDFPAAIALLENQPALSQADRMQLATLYWRTRQPERALALLDFEPDDPAMAESHLSMRLELATTLGRTEVLREAYEQLLARDENELTPALQEQLLGLAVLFEDYPRALRLSQRRYQETGEPRFIEATAEYQLALGRWQALENTLQRWQKETPGARQNVRYWSMQALIQERNGNVSAANESYRKAWQLAPDDENLMISWAWLKLANPTIFADSLDALLARLAQTTSAEAFPVLAYGYSALGKPQQALHWFRRGLDIRDADPQWLRATADLLEQTGSPGTATNLRQLVPEQPPVDSPAQRSEPLYPVPENRQQLADRYLRQLQQLDRPMAATQRQDTLRDTVNLHQNFNRAVQVGSQWQNLGNFTVRRTGVTGQFSQDELRWLVSAETLDADSSGRLNKTPGRNTEASITLDRRSGNAAWSLSASLLPRYQKNDLALSASYDWQVFDRIVFGTGYRFRERTPDSAEAWWLTRRHRAYFSVGYTPFSRMNLNSQVEQLTVNSLEDDQLAEGFGLDLNATYTLFRNDPAWTVSAGYRNQQLSLTDALPASTTEALNQPLAPAGLLTENYERIGVSTRWFSGEPHALYRSTPSPRLFLGLDAGYVLSTSSTEFGVDAGLGWRLLGDDELALSGRWSSEGLDGDGRTELNLTYTLYLGR